MSGDGIQGVLEGIRHLVRLVRLSHVEAKRRVGLSAAQLFVLQTLEEARGLSLKDVAERTATDQSSVSAVVARLVASGVVERRRSAEDRRRLVLGLTPRGRVLVRRGPARLAQHALVGALGRLSTSEQRTLARLLQRVVAGMGGDGGPPGMFFEKPPVPRSPRKEARRGH
jgi:DNA-binding MarR family transcriptional regulator